MMEHFSFFDFFMYFILSAILLDVIKVMSTLLYVWLQIIYEKMTQNNS